MDAGAVVAVDPGPPFAGIEAGVDDGAASVVVAMVVVLAGAVVLSALDVLVDEVTVGSAWAMPAPVISAAPNPTVIAEFFTHAGTSWAVCTRCRPRPALDAFAARALALARFFTR
ncbi:hypothetical protein OG579_15240 [Williamsia herbipolensis]|uniref:Uncharacterized protein n=1 Tax=Williamsia herbipolensis TaxID=1603258 RepID=A0AAU4JZ83_9NOCA|nr:hypothetical protein [Williamsia herbipolensis]